MGISRTVDEPRASRALADLERALGNALARGGLLWLAGRSVLFLTFTVGWLALR